MPETVDSFYVTFGGDQASPLLPTSRVDYGVLENLIARNDRNVVDGINFEGKLATNVGGGISGN